MNFCIVCYFKNFLYTKFDSLYIASNFVLSIINSGCDISTFSLNIYLYGNLGIGKTFFVKGLVKGSGIDDIVQSSTYGICKEYLCKNFNIYHFDLYRIDNAFEFGHFYNINGINIFEWPNKFVDFIYKPDFLINIFSLNDKKYITIDPCSFFSKRILFSLRRLC